MPEAPQWARVRGEMNCYIRRGAWYEVLRLTPEEVVLEVNRQYLSGQPTELPCDKCGGVFAIAWDDPY